VLKNWIDQGSLPALRVGRRVRIRQSDLDRFLAAGRTSDDTSDKSPGTVAEHPSELLSRQQLAARLDRSTRWVDTQVSNGMPSLVPTAEFPHRRFLLTDVEGWLAQRDAPSQGDGEVSAADLQTLAGALGKTIAAAHSEDPPGLVDALRGVAAAADRLADTLSRQG
jgi:hypothetical protein